MQTTPNRDRRGAAWTATKLAVRAYSRNPTDDNAFRVRAACGQLRVTSQRDVRGDNPGAESRLPASAKDPLRRG